MSRPKKALRQNNNAVKKRLRQVSATMSSPMLHVQLGCWAVWTHTSARHSRIRGQTISHLLCLHQLATKVLMPVVVVLVPTLPAAVRRLASAAADSHLRQHRDTHTHTHNTGAVSQRACGTYGAAQHSTAYALAHQSASKIQMLLPAVCSSSSMAGCAYIVGR